MGIRFRLNIALLAVVFVVIGGVIGLEQSLLDRAYGRLAESRFLFVSNSLKSALEVNAGLGFALHEVRQAQELIEREKAEDRQILAVEVLDQQGRSLFSTDRGTIGEDPPQAWLDALQAAGGRQWRSVDRDAIIIGVPINNDFDQTIGYVALSYSASYFDRQFDAVAERLLWSGLAIFTILMPMVFILVWIFTRVVERQPAVIHEVFSAPPTGDDRLFSPKEGDGLIMMALSVRHRLIETELALDQVGRELQKLDEDL